MYILPYVDSELISKYLRHPYAPTVVTCPRCRNDAILSYDVILSFFVANCQHCGLLCDALQLICYHQFGYSKQLDTLLHNAIINRLVRPNFTRLMDYYITLWWRIWSYHRRFRSFCKYRERHPIRVRLSQYGLSISHDTFDLLKQVIIPITSKEAVKLLGISRIPTEKGIIIPLYSSLGLLAGFYCIFGEHGRFISAPYNNMRIAGMANLESAYRQSKSFPQFDDWFFITTDFSLFANLLSAGVTASQELLPVGFTVGGTVYRRYQNVVEQMIEKVVLPFRTPVVLNPQYTATDLDVLAIYDALVLMTPKDKKSSILSIAKNLHEAVYWMDWIAEDLRKQAPHDVLPLLVKLPIRRQLGYMYLQNRVLSKSTLREFNADTEQYIIFDNRAFIVGRTSISSGRQVIATYRPEVLAVIGNKYYLVEVRTKSFTRQLIIDANNFFLNLHRAIAQQIDGPEKSEISCVTSWRSRLAYLALTYSQPEFFERLPGFTDRGFRLAKHLITYRGEVVSAPGVMTSYGVEIQDPSFSMIKENKLKRILANLFVKLTFSRRFLYQEMPIIVPANEKTATILETALYLIRSPFPNTDDIYGENSKLFDLQQSLDWPVGIRFTGSLTDFHYLIRRYKNLIVLNHCYAQLVWTQDIAVVDLSAYEASQLDGFDQFFVYAIKQALTKPIDLPGPAIYSSFPFREQSDKTVFYINTQYPVYERHLLVIKYAVQALSFYGKPAVPSDYVLAILSKYHGLQLSEHELIEYLKKANRLGNFPLESTQVSLPLIRQIAQTGVQDHSQQEH